MAIAFKKVTLPPLQGFTANVPDGTIVGIIGEDGSGKGNLLRVAAGTQKPISGSVTTGKTKRLLGPDDALNFAPVEVLLLDQTFARYDATVKGRALVALERLRRAGSTILLSTHDESLVARICDEVWWLVDGRLAGRGDAESILASYRRHISDKMRQWGESISNPVAFQNRVGDARAEVLSVETLGTTGRPTAIWRSGEQAEIRVAIRFNEHVADPVIGVLLRTRIGLDVYGTNTQLEGLHFGPCAAGQVVRLSFAFHCDLCPQEYTLTVASHDPDGTRHDWLEDAVAIAVVDERPTAGVCNLRARVTLS